VNMPKKNAQTMFAAGRGDVKMTNISRTATLLSLCAITLFGASICYTQTPSESPNKPPAAPVRPVTDDYFGTKIADNYRYMENLKDPEVQEWFKNQNDYTRATLASIPGREKLLARLQNMSQSAPVLVTNVRFGPGDLYFYQKRLPGENSAKVYLRHGLSGEERLLADPEKVTVTALNQAKGRNGLGSFMVSDDGKYVAVSIIPGGSENDTEIHVIDVATAHETGDVVLRALSGVTAWLPDNHSFTYNRLQDLPSGAPRTEIRQKERIHLHTLGSDPQKDPAVFGYGVVPSIDLDPVQYTWIKTSPGSQYALSIIFTGVALENDYYIEPAEALSKPNSAWRKFAGPSDKVTDVAMHGDDLYLLTFKDSSRYKILRTDARNPNVASAEIVVPPSEAIVKKMTASHDALYVELMDGGINRILRVPYGPKPKVENIELSVQGSPNVVEADPRVSGILFVLTSWTKGPELYAYDPQTKHVTNTHINELGPSGHDDNVEAVDVKVKSHDGTLVPLSIVYPKGMKLDGSHPTILTGYGAYGDARTYFPHLTGNEIVWHERGGISAICGVRGGGEYGEDWHVAGKGSAKPNTWHDFIACAEYLIEKRYTSPAHLAGQGASAGGILIGRAITDRPDLFGAAIINAGTLDMLRNETTSNGIGNIPEFGSTKTEEGFQALLAMSSYHHVTDKTSYPAVLLVVGINDPRVDPWESAKMTARLQAATSSGKPVLLRVNYAGGHGGGGGMQEAQESTADVWSFLLWQFGDPEFQPKVAKQ
jgi:prolyl oligopeptidase